MFKPLIRYFLTRIKTHLLLYIVLCFQSKFMTTYPFNGYFAHFKIHIQKSIKWNSLFLCHQWLWSQGCFFHINAVLIIHLFSILQHTSKIRFFLRDYFLFAVYFITEPSPKASPLIEWYLDHEIQMDSTFQSALNYNIEFNYLSATLPGGVTNSDGYWRITSLLRDEFITKLQSYRAWQLTCNLLCKGHKDSTYFFRMVLL